MALAIKQMIASCTLFMTVASCGLIETVDQQSEDFTPQEATQLNAPDVNADNYFSTALDDRLEFNIQEHYQFDYAAHVDQSITIEDPLWQRLVSNYGLSEQYKLRVEQEIARYRIYGRDFENTLARAMPFMPLILEQIEKHNVPAEIALLPIVESSFNPHARSSFSAVGIWQFIPTTGAEYGLKQNWWYDARRDIVLSTKAAITYLSKLNKRFDGDWLLALAAYNAGQANVARAIKKAKKNNQPTDYWNLKLPTETRYYVPRLLAVSRLVASAPYYRISLPDSSNNIDLALVDTGGQIDLSKAAEASGLNLKTLYKFNPGFKRWASDPNGPHHLLIPAENKAQFEQNISAIPAAERVTWYRHKIRRGDSLSKIAKRYETNVNLIKQVNQLRSNTIRAGKYLLVPNSNLSLKEHIAFDVNSGARKHVHKVRRGDTLWEVAKQYGVSIKQICSWNRINPKKHLKVGQKLIVIEPIRST